jgi:hypothetical protein
LGCREGLEVEMIFGRIDIGLTRKDVLTGSVENRLHERIALPSVINCHTATGFIHIDTIACPIACTTGCNLERARLRCIQSDSTTGTDG